MPRLNKSIETTVDFHFPKAGFSIAGPFGVQPIREISGVYCRTTADCVNVRGFDPKTLRDRGGTRPGLSRLIDEQVSELFIIQHLNVLVTTSQLGATVQTSSSGRIVTLLTVSQGVVKTANPDSTTFTATTNNSGEEPPLNITGVMQSAQNNQKMYFVDGINYVYYAPATNSIELWTATAGALPVDSDNNTARLICTWRGRTVLSGLLKDPQNWFMSKVSDPHNWESLASPFSATNAVAGNNAELGLIGDVVTALIPANDDVLFFGGDHTLYRMTGDPLAGGQIDRVSDVIGVAWGEAWCKDPYGNIYFFSNRCGIYKLDSGFNSKPVRVSQAIESLIQDVNTGTNTIRMLWNDRSQGVHIFVTKTDEPAATRHYFWEMRTNAWQPDSFTDSNMNPVCCTAFDGNDPNDRRLLIGSWDGYVRVLDPEAPDDDGEPIRSHVLIGPIMTQEADTMLLRTIQAIMAEGSSPVRYSVHVGRTAEAALAAPASTHGVWNAGRNNVSPIRRADHAIYVKIDASQQWAMEAISAVFGPMGKVRRRS